MEGVSQYQFFKVFPFGVTFQTTSCIGYNDFFLMLRKEFGNTLNMLEKDEKVKIQIKELRSALFNNSIEKSHPWHKINKPKAEKCLSCGKYKDNTKGVFYDYDESPRGFWFGAHSSIPSVLKQGDTFSFTFTLCGKLVDYFPLLVKVFQSMWKKESEINLVSIHQKFADGTLGLIWNNKSESDNKTDVPTKGIKFSDFAHARLITKELVIHYITPVSLSKQTDNFGCVLLPQLTEELAKRLSMLSYSYCDSTFMWDESYLKEEIRGISVADSHLNWKKHGVLNGYTGTVAYSVFRASNPVLNKILPLLLLGQYTHIGRNIPFGGGQYIISYECYSLI